MSFLDKFGMKNILCMQNEIPPRVEYFLTEKGKALLPVFAELAKWGENHLE